MQWGYQGPSNSGYRGDAMAYNGFGPAYRPRNIAPLSEHRRTHVGISDIVETLHPVTPGLSECGLTDVSKGKRKADAISGASPMEESIWGLDLEPRALINGPNPVKKAAPSPARSSSTTKLPQLKNDSSTYTAKHGLLSSESAAPELLDSETGRLDDKVTSALPIIAPPMAARTFAPALIEPVPQITVVPSMPCRAEVTTVRPVKRARLRKLVEGIGYAAVGGLTVGTLVFGSLVYTAPSMG